MPFVTKNKVANVNKQDPFSQPVKLLLTTHTKKIGFTFTLNH